MCPDLTESGSAVLVLWRGEEMEANGFQLPRLYPIFDSVHRANNRRYSVYTLVGNNL